VLVELFIAVAIAIMIWAHLEARKILKEEKKEDDEV
jgi:hypothetical protein